MRELNHKEIFDVHGGKKFFKIVVGAVFTGVVEGLMGFAADGPVGFVVGFGHGLYDGAAGTIIYEGAMGLTQTLHPQLEGVW